MYSLCFSEFTESARMGQHFQYIGIKLNLILLFVTSQ